MKTELEKKQAEIIKNLNDLSNRYRTITDKFDIIHYVIIKHDLDTFINDLESEDLRTEIAELEQEPAGQVGEDMKTLIDIIERYEKKYQGLFQWEFDIVNRVKKSILPSESKQEEAPKHPTSWRDFTMTDGDYDVYVKPSQRKTKKYKCTPEQEKTTMMCMDCNKTIDKCDCMIYPEGYPVHDKDHSEKLVRPPKGAEEILAELAHKQWSGWMKYLFSKGEFKDGLWIMPKWAVDRWTKQMNIDYINLSKDEQESDKVEARKFIKAMEQYHNSKRKEELISYHEWLEDELENPVYSRRYINDYLNSK